VFNYKKDTLDTIKGQIHQTYESVGIIQKHNYSVQTFQLLENTSKSTLTNVSTLDRTLITWKEYIAFFEWFISNGTRYIDLFTCNLWSNKNWIYVIETIRKMYNVQIRASIHIIGEGGDFVKYSGFDKPIEPLENASKKGVRRNSDKLSSKEFFLESHNVNTIGIYFLPDILNYKYAFYDEPSSLYSKNLKCKFPTSNLGSFNSTDYSSTNSDELPNAETHDPMAETHDPMAETHDPMAETRVPLGHAFRPLGVDRTSVIVFLNEDNEFTIPDLEIGSEYTISLTATNSVGTSDEITRTIASPFSKPVPPLISRITDGDKNSTVEFVEGKPNGTILMGYEYSIDQIDYGKWKSLQSITDTDRTGYEETPENDETQVPLGVRQSVIDTVIIQVYDGSFVLTGLTNGVQYGIRMRVNSDKGYSTQTNISYCRPFTTPENPVVESIIAKNWQATIVCSVINNGRDVTEILYSFDGGKTHFSNGSNLTIVLSNLLNYNTYTICIKAINEAGESKWSPEYSFVPYYLNTELPLIKKSFTGNNTLTKAQLYAMTVRNAKGNIQNLYK
jgi:hypothetical protein